MKIHTLTNIESISLALMRMVVIKEKGYHIRGKYKSVKEAKKVKRTDEIVAVNDANVFILTRNLKHAQRYTTLKQMIRKHKTHKHLMYYENPFCTVAQLKLKKNKIR